MTRKAKDQAEVIREIRALREAVETPRYVFRGDSAAARFAGFKSSWRFSEWAVKHGLKPKLKTNAHERTIYRVEDLRKALDRETAEQFERNLSP